MTIIKFVYLANVIVAGYIGIFSLFLPKLAASIIFQQVYPPNDTIRLVGCFWLAIALLSAFGLWRPITFSPLLLLQLIYKSLWLIIVALPAFKNHQPFPLGMALFFLICVVVLPFVIPWSVWAK